MKKKKVITTKVIMNEQHSLLPEQRELIEKRFGKEREGWEFVKSPAKGWTLEEIFQQAESLLSHNVIFVSPVPALVAKLSFFEGFAHKINCIESNADIVGSGTKVFLLHNDKREKKELPDGKVIMTLSSEGWQLVNTNSELDI